MDGPQMTSKISVSLYFLLSTYVKNTYNTFSPGKEHFPHNKKTYQFLCAWIDFQSMQE